MKQHTHTPDLSPEEAIEQLQQGAKLENVRIEGLVLSGSIDFPLVMKHVELVAPKFSDVTFKAPVRIVASRILRPSIGKKAVFEDGLHLSGSVVEQFGMTQCTVQGGLHMQSTRFEGHARFNRCNFEGPIRGWSAAFNDWLDFNGCTFKEKVDLRSIACLQGVNFDDCNIEADLALRGAEIAKKLNLGESRCNALLDLSKAKLHDFVYLESIQAGPNLRYAFLNAIAPRIHIQPGQIEGRLESEHERNLAAAKLEYGLLKHSFQSLHKFDEEDWAYYKFKVCDREQRRRESNNPFHLIRYLGGRLFLDWGCGYGTRPTRAIATAGVIICLFTLVYALGIDSFTVDQPPVASQPVDSVSNRILYGLVTSVSVFTAGFTGSHLSIAHGWMLIPLALEALMGTLLWGLFIVAFSRKVIR